MAPTRSCCCLFVCLAAACSSSHVPTAPALSPSLAADPSSGAGPAASGPEQVECRLHCDAPRFVPRVAPEPDYTQREIDNATEVLSSMKDDLLRCYTKRLRSRPDARAFLTVDILVGNDGHVRRVDTTGGAQLGDPALACIVHRIEKGVFEPPHGGGNIHVQMPFTLEVAAPDTET
jgi:hypothetical protein